MNEAKTGLDITEFVKYFVGGETLLHQSASRGVSVFSIKVRLVDSELG